MGPNNQRFRRRQAILLAAGGLALLGRTGRVQAGVIPSFRFASIDGGMLDTAEWRGRPVLVVNTASLCGFARQFDALQDLQDRFGKVDEGQGLVVLAVPSGDFRQELGSDAEVKDYCEMNFDLTLAMTAITPVRGAGAHPFYRWLADDYGFEPDWNFNKVLLGPDGVPREFWRAPVAPMSAPVLTAVTALLAQG